MEEQTKSTKIMKIVLGTVIIMVILAGGLSALFYDPNGACQKDESVQDNTEISIDAPDVTKEAAPF